MWLSYPILKVAPPATSKAKMGPTIATKRRTSRIPPPLSLSCSSPVGASPRLFDLWACVLSASVKRRGNSPEFLQQLL
jgi:hypothetical protein